MDNSLDLLVYAQTSGLGKRMEGKKGKKKKDDCNKIKCIYSGPEINHSTLRQDQRVKRRTCCPFQKQLHRNKPISLRTPLIPHPLPVDQLSFKIGGSNGNMKLFHTWRSFRVSDPLSQQREGMSKHKRTLTPPIPPSPPVSFFSYAWRDLPNS